MWYAANNGLTNLKNAVGYCRYNSNNPLYIKQCVNKFMNPYPPPQLTNAQVQNQIDSAFNKCQGNQQCFVNAMNNFR